ncbi:TetR/AcrR family transcriptional regulator [Corallococcus praedator]|uniref:TetR/AcrR family transcriptional regulator n=1 Tax=Corallococcus praedator TaxID=2316724 RepID=A0ABX9QQ88_9BACT|nr:MULTISPECIES: TetR family transcriptional regulator [Corallococcus]RKH34696.1 TetR/AcrR family transcriptional regulator [Corallococcus sp. CA031C]RKI14591.1 TetR/AcrR family transcriptional regulator [Corallococcus praedator]
MAGDAQKTRQRLLEAAAAEFSERGIAGARVDRIAASAGCNKALIYSYFGSKEQLFDAVFEAHVAEVAQETPIDASDLPAYAGKLFDGFQVRPQVLRLATWYELEHGPEAGIPERVLKNNQHKVAAITRAQREGTVTKHFAADELLALVLALAKTWSFPLSYCAGPTPPSPAEVRRRRRSVVEAVRLLVTPVSPGA